VCKNGALAATKPTNVSRETLFIRAGVHFNLFCARRRLFLFVLLFAGLQEIEVNYTPAIPTANSAFLLQV
jgi:hypothetical protein